MKNLQITTLISLVVLCLVNCTSSSKTSQASFKVTASYIVFVNVRNHTRMGVASMVKKALAYDAKVVGLLPLFQTWNNLPEDTALLKATRDQRVIFSAYADDFNDGSFSVLPANKIFIHPKITNEGVVAYVVPRGDSAITGFYPLISDSKKQWIAFPYLIAEKFDIEVYDRHDDNIRVNKPQNLSMHFDLDGFEMLSDNFVQSQVKDKIVIFDDFESSRGEMEIYAVIDGRKVKTNVAIITANIILYYLSDKGSYP